MGRYMTVALKEAYKKDSAIQTINEELKRQYGANNPNLFVTWQYLQEEADFINHDPEGLKQLPDWKRPISKEDLCYNFFWYRYGEFSFKLSGGGTADEAKNAVAVCKWIKQTKGKYIDKKQSSDYSPAIVQQYLNYLFEEDGYDLAALWELP